jgi:signal transduction histidine kinase
VPVSTPPPTDHDVVAAFVHRMGSPLGALTNLLHLARAGGDLAPLLVPLDRSAASARVAFRGLQRWIEALRVDLGAPEDVDLTAVLGQAARPLLGDRVPRLPGPLCRARARPAAVGRAMAEVMDNVVRHGGGGVRRVEAWMRDGLVHLALDDAGPGWPPPGPEVAFRPFGGAGGAGGGVGLAIVRGLVAGEGGAAWGEAAPGGGARVVIALPAVP